MSDIFGEIEPEIALFTETMLKSDTGYNFEGYSFFGKSRKNKAAGGVGILVRNDCKNIVTPHEVEKNIELIWISIKRKNTKPLFIGVYYGKQESRNNRNEMLKEMDDLGSEIQEKTTEGDLILFMDGNGKIGLLGENVSRNGNFLISLFDECELEIMNKSEKCVGKITRVNRANVSEVSAIDFVLSTPQAEKLIRSLTIDESCDYVLKGGAMSDHNSIIVDLNVNEKKERAAEKIVKWRINAPLEKWELFEKGLQERALDCNRLVECDSLDMNEKYQKWKNLITSKAMSTIGKTTIKTNKLKRESYAVKNLRKEKRVAKHAFQNENDYTEKGKLLSHYVAKQNELRQQIRHEEEEQVERRLTRMAEDGVSGFWREVRNMNRDELSQWTCIKDNDGRCIHDPEMQKEIVAKYYEELYSFDSTLEEHPYHTYVKNKMDEYDKNKDFDNMWYCRPPNKRAIENVVLEKKNKKATTDFPNEILKRGGKGFIECLYPIIKHFWESEIPPQEWNEGIITNVWKGKGDREKLKFQRGITVSSSISMLCEQLINERMIELVKMTQAQGGGKKGSATRDHVFLLRGAITHAIKNKECMYVTFYDVAKAYDRADVEDMLVIAWEHGVKGKLWRLLKNLNTNLTAKVKTKNGLTRVIQRKAGGKQGGKNFGFLFAKMMDVLAEEMENETECGVMFGNLKMSVLEWVDDVVTFSIGNDQQKRTLGLINEFAIKHKLKWGGDKCKVMEIGNQTFKQKMWKLGNQEISSSDSYKYLGDIIMKNGGNKRNIEEREMKAMASTRKILAMCSNDIFQKIKLKALIKLHNSCTIAGFLTNCETWVLNKSERNKLETIELRSLKKILNVPKTTPTVAIWYITGVLKTSILIDKRQMLYLKTILDKADDNWIKQMFYCLLRDDIGWARQMNKTLEEYGVKEDISEIEKLSKNAWKKIVQTVTEKRNREDLIELCIGRNKEKTKTKVLLKRLRSDTYERKPCMKTLEKTRILARTRIMSEFYMLDCATNYKVGYRGVNCNICKVLDDENHRINMCGKYQETNLAKSPVKIDFSYIHSENEETVERILYVINQIWDLKNDKNTMK